jgi:predicted nucleic acid-binding protein
VKGIADTGFLVAFVNRADEHHDWAVSIAERVTEPLLSQRLACFSISGFSFLAFPRS